MKNVIQILLVLWFVIAGVLVLGGGIMLMVTTYTFKVVVPPPPAMPKCTLECNKPGAMEAALKAYTAQTQAYERQLAVIKAEANLQRSPALDTYKAVAKETIEPLLTTILTALVGYVFVKGTATVANNFLLLRANQEPRKLDLP